MSKMLCKSVFLLALLFGLVAAARPQFHHGQKISKLSGDALIQAACDGVSLGGDESECVSTLKSATPDQKADANALALFTLRFVENHAENITTAIKKISAVPDVGPFLQSALTDCMEQYNSLDDLIEDANDAVSSHSYPDAQKFIMAGFSSVELCDSQLKASNFEEKAENKTGEDVVMARDLTKYVLLHKKLLAATLNILTLD
ncbi:uncharacterized protein LOC131007283 [Salvia miltiorrhiza]|uniref:uncharacterized protein LOC131007283 n=1 Tax=Salvia miltiorrhiza TaxID=226208 RepID=UPI0025ABA552|nr:uncharacterized protein LOC131007283 [Salvia miltiorrhiza]XP_057790413.1 uncharacterized protein LOC131007283 [Salvia miltiorrhiza]